MSTSPAFVGSVAPAGDIKLRLIKGGQLAGGPPPAVDYPGRPVKMSDVVTYGLPNRAQPDHVNEWRLRNTKNLWRGARQVAMARALKLPHFYGQLWLTVLRGDGTVEELGLASLRLVTTAGVTYIATRLFDANTSIGNFDFHGFGTGGTAEAIGDTALVTEETTQYVVDNTRPTGTPTNPSGTVYRSVGTYSPDSGGTRAITEHGLFSASSAGTLLDRSLFSAVNLVASSDSLQATYDFTIAAGG